MLRIPFKSIHDLEKFDEIIPNHDYGKVTGMPKVVSKVDEKTGVMVSELVFECEDLSLRDKDLSVSDFELSNVKDLIQKRLVQYHGETLDTADQLVKRADGFIHEVNVAKFEAERAEKERLAKEVAENVEQKNENLEV